MSARTNGPATAMRARPPGAPPGRRFRIAGLPVPASVALLLGFHVACVVPGILRNSITFDENFHLPAGALYLARGYTHVSLGQPPLARALYALPIVPMRPALPPDSILTLNAERAAGRSFLALNAARFERLYLAGRVVALALSLVLGLLIFGWARRLYGRRGGLLALAAWVALPESVAQAGLIGMDLPTALAFVLVVLALRRLARRGRAIDVAWLALAWGAALLTRYSAIQLVPVAAALALWAVAARRAARPTWLLGGLAAALVAGVVVLNAGYLGQVSMLPMGERALTSRSLGAIARVAPWLRLPLPDAYIAGFDYLSFVTESVKPIFAFGPRDESVWWYFPLAAAVKWPLGWIGLLALRGVRAARHSAAPGWDTATVLLPALAVVAVCVTSDLDYGLRYLLPAMPFLCVWVGGLAADPAAAPRLAGAAEAAPRRARGGSPARRAARGWAFAAAALAAAQALECAAATPWQLSHFNLFAAGRGERIVNDSNVDWGQGLIALRDEMKARGIRRILLTYHGTTDPALYGIDYVPYTGGVPDSGVSWLAVSSYYFVGLAQRMVTPQDDTPYLGIDFRPYWDLPPVARPGRCMLLFRLR
jgi:hypothetical protein